MSVKGTKVSTRERVWFKVKRYGYGWYPATWEGWTTVVVFLIAVLWLTTRVESYAASRADFFFYYVLPLGALISLLIALSFRYGEKPLKWRWGSRK